MITLYKSDNLGRSDLGWLQSWFHFSFADYHNPDRVQFGPLRVINDDLIKPGQGFGQHPHRNMEIISYIVDGELTHGDSMGNNKALTRGQIQYMSAGRGILHSEFNYGKETCRLLQIWILPDRTGYEPRYGDHAFPWNDRGDTWLHLVSSEQGAAPVKIHQDVNLYATVLTAGKSASLEVQPGRQAYLVLIEGSARINGDLLSARDGLETIGESLSIDALETSHLLVIEMAV